MTQTPRPRGAREALLAGRIELRAETCERCGQHHLRCSGHMRERDENRRVIAMRPCWKFPMRGQSVCYSHGGNGRNKVSARRQWEKEHEESKEMERAERAVKTFGLPVTITPQQALLDEIARTAGHVAWLGEMISNLPIEDSVWGRVSEEHREGVGEMETQIDLTTTVRGARPAVWYQLYQQERAHLVHVAKVAIQCGIAERQVKLAEEQGQMIAQVLRQVLEAPELELTVVQASAARAMASKVLRSMSSGKVIDLPVLPTRNGHGG